VILVWGKYGVVPTEINKGELNANSRYDYSAMVLEMESYLKYIEGNEFWYEELVPSSLRLNMDKYMGRPPEEFMYEFKEIIPHEFLNTVVKLNLDDYIGVRSTF
jgi:bleomycin hydrolase